MLFRGDEREAARLFELGMLRRQNSYMDTFAGDYATTGNLSALTHLLSASSYYTAVREPWFRLYTDKGYDIEAFRSDLRQRTSIGDTSIPTYMDPENFDPQNYGDLFWNPYSAYALRPDLLDGKTSEWRRTWLQRRGVVDYWRAVEFPPQCRPIGNDDFRCEPLGM